MQFKMAANRSRRTKLKATLVSAITSGKFRDMDLADQIRSGLFDLQVRNPKQETPLHVACEMGLLETAEALLKLGADPNARDWRHSTPLLRAIARSGSLKLVELLIKYKVEINTNSNAMNPPIDQAITSMRMDIARLLLREGADVGRTEVAGTVLHTAVTTEDVEICREVSRWGVNLEAENGIGQTALAVAVIVGVPGIVRVLVQAGCDPNRRNGTGTTPLEDARELKARSVLSALKMSRQRE